MARELERSDAFVVLIPYISAALEKAVWIEGKVPEERDWKTLKSMEMVPAEAHGLDPDRPSARLRLDWELSQSALDDNKNGDDLEEAIRGLMASQMAADFADLVVNGDKESPDPLLHTMDGELKLGQRMVEFKHGNILWYREFKERKDTWEYTAYTRIQPVFK